MITLVPGDGNGEGCGHSDAREKPRGPQVFAWEEVSYNIIKSFSPLSLTYLGAEHAWATAHVCKPEDTFRSWSSPFLRVQVPGIKVRSTG